MKPEVGQNLRYLFGDDDPCKVVCFKGFWDVQRNFDPLPCLKRGELWKGFVYLEENCSKCKKHTGFVEGEMSGYDIGGSWVWAAKSLSPSAD